MPVTHSAEWEARTYARQKVLRYPRPFSRRAVSPLARRRFFTFRKDLLLPSRIQSAFFTYKLDLRATRRLRTIARIGFDLEHLYPNNKNRSVPKFSWQRPTGRYHERQFFAVCVNEIMAFQSRVKRRMPKKDKSQQSAAVRFDPANGWHDRQHPDDFGGVVRLPDQRIRRAWFVRGMTTRDIYTKGAHFALFKKCCHGD